MTEYLIPSGTGEAEFTEKRSRFLGHVAFVETEEEARAFIAQVGKTHHDARHNCFCYRLLDGIERYSDDGEPQGTAGIPLLEIFQREGVTNVVCVVTRYFGGILLGAGGLLRAYSRSGKDALDAAGISVVKPWTALNVPCSYPLFEQVKREILACEGGVGEIAYGENVVVEALLPQGMEETLNVKLRELSAGTIQAEVTGQVWRATPR
ncbi:MAG: YigZ family protein [Oscillospiraceae bacterium]